MDIFLDNGSEVTAVSEALADKIERKLPKAAAICPFDEQSRVVTALGMERNILTQTCSVHVLTKSSWDEVRVTVPFVILPGSGCLVVVVIEYSATYWELMYYASENVWFRMAVVVAENRRRRLWCKGRWSQNLPR